MDQKLTPMFDALVQHINYNPHSYHVPGHKNGALFPKKGLHFFENILRIDATELTGLDDLHAPESAIAQAQQLTAELYGADQSFFLVNGSTAGNLAMVLAVCEENDTVLVQRNSHKSIFNSIQLAGVKPVFLAPYYDDKVKTAAHVPIETIKQAIKEHPKAKAIILTNPNYYGQSVDLTEVISFAHDYNIPVLVDEAHGAHFNLGQPFPISAIECGADIVVHSAHKTLPAMTMGSFIHVKSNLVDINNLVYYLQLFQTSSPSYPIMASLDLARYYLNDMKDTGKINQLVEKINQYTEILHSIPQIQVVRTNNPSILTDPLKVTVQSDCVLSGYDLQKLFEDYGVYTELADPDNVLFIFPLSNDDNLFKPLLSIENILRSVEITKMKSSNVKMYSNDNISTLTISYSQLKSYNKKVIPLKDAVGQLCAQMLIPYPPGVPLLIVGEEITESHIERILNFKALGAKFHGGQLLKQNEIEIFDR
ncbi:aminotransferase class I/II-fold pyridoxal phosphate-dependent enzyme [Cytobacillus sp. Hm23]